MFCDAICIAVSDSENLPRLRMRQCTTEIKALFLIFLNAFWSKILEQNSLKIDNW